MTDAKVIHEIPIYAMNKEELHRKYAKLVSTYRTEYSHSDKDTVNALIALASYPQRLWEYNHLVGFIRISVTSQDVLFDVFLPMPSRKRYIWTSGRKIFLFNVSANGTHFYVNETMPNCSIQTQVAEMLSGVIKEHVPARYYVDTATFENTNPVLDYRKIMNVAN